MASLFLSYSREDAKEVGPLAAALEADGHQVWWDRHISGGQEFADEIERALESADAVVVCWTSHSVHSDWVRDEAGSGRDRGRLVPITLDGCQPPLGFRQYQTIDLSGWNGRSRSPTLEPLRAAIAEKASGATQSIGRPAAHGAGWRTRMQFRRLAMVAATLFFLLAGTAYFYLARSGSDTIEPKVAVGQFGLASADLPRALPNMVGQEIVAAFGAENAVTVISPGDRN